VISGPPSRRTIEGRLATLRQRAREHGALGDSMGRIEVWKATASDDDGAPERVGDTPAITITLGEGADD
jgi:hypothetical protein